MDPYTCRNWEAEKATNSWTPSFEEWVKVFMEVANVDVTSEDDMERVMLSKKPSQRALRYLKMKSFGNHFRVEDESTANLQTFDGGVASVFQIPCTNATDVSVNYVGMLTDILKLDYGPLRAPVILLRCDWMKKQDNRGNATYTRDEAGFLLVNFKHKMPRMSEPFIFPSQATQVFFSDARDKPGWKVVLQKEARARREVVDTTDVFITTRVEPSGLVAPDEFPRVPVAPSLIGAIELSAEDNVLACARY